MKVVTTISEDDAAHINRFIQLAGNSEFNTHGKLDYEILARMLLEDVALAIRRPGSWEGSSMGQLLTSHGYEI